MEDRFDGLHAAPVLMELLIRHLETRSRELARKRKTAPKERSMKRIVQAGIIVVLCLGNAAASWAAQTDDILGVWFNGEKDARIEILKCGDRYCGKVVWLKEPDYPEGSKDGVPGTPKVDHNNPDAARRSVPIIGLQIVRDFRYAGNDLWKDGRVYDPKNGKTYRGKMTLVSPGRLDLRGFIGISLIGRTTTWTR